MLRRDVAKGGPRAQGRAGPWVGVPHHRGRAVPGGVEARNRLSRLRRQGIGRLSFHTDGLRFAPSADSRTKRRAGALGGSDRFFPWDEVKALNVVYQDQLEFYFGRTLYVFRFPRHDTSAHKYELCGWKLEEIRNGTNRSPLA